MGEMAGQQEAGCLIKRYSDAAWTSDELNKIGTAEELQIAAFALTARCVGR